MRHGSPSPRRPRFALRAPRPSLAGQLLMLQLTLIVVVLVVVAWVSVVQANANFRRTEGSRLLSTAESVASQGAVRVGLSRPERGGILQPSAESARSVSGASSVEIATPDRRILTAADPRRIGGRLELGDSTVLSGRSWIGTLTVGERASLVAQVPVFGENGELLGVVAVGSHSHRFMERVMTAAPDMLFYVGFASGIGSVGSYLLARRIKKQTLGLEPGEIAALVRHREAMLHGITEGVLGLDVQERVTLANDSVRELLRLPPDAADRTLTDLGVEEVVRDALTGRTHGRDQVVFTADRVLTLNRMPLVTHGQTVGSVTTMRDLTELAALKHQLETTRNATDTLRAQAHEFSNHLHVIAGLLALREYPEVSRYVRGISGTHAQRTADVQAAVADPSLAALLIAKASLAAEQGAALRVTETGRALGPLPESLSSDLVTVVGNLVDNALDAVRDGDSRADDTGGDGGTGDEGDDGGGRDGAWVRVEFEDDGEEVRVRVRDSGPGVDPTLGEKIFRQGFTTKADPRPAGSGRGLGLAITRLVCGRRGGGVSVDGAAFLARLPRTAPERERSGAPL
ncbi:sensor histidine kinase [Streptomyces sp. SBT349]|uniref:sensor histidine kinase n=1 Tax=Streptomyces sp. SBT349 TaxID=1580539 RepID=UPI00066D2DD4|nr:sensor histidine kinase [Streptomyces sp. SBT349]